MKVVEYEVQTFKQELVCGCGSREWDNLGGSSTMMQTHWLYRCRSCFTTVESTNVQYPRIVHRPTIPMIERSLTDEQNIRMMRD